MLDFRESLLKNPVKELGSPLPPEAGCHAVSVSLPKWEDVVGYEEGESYVLKAMKTGYPRFFMPEPNRELSEKLRDIFARAFSSEKMLKLMAQKQIEACGEGVFNFEEIERSTGTIVSASSHLNRKDIKDWWQHTGLGLSSRAADTWNNEGDATYEEGASHYKIESQLANTYNVSEEDVLLSGSGMTSINIARIFCEKLWQEKTGKDEPAHTIQFGFPYTDSLKSQEKFGEVTFLGKGDGGDLEALKKLLEQDPDKFSGIFLEFPTNPLLKASDLEAIRRLADKAGVPVVIDDTLAPPTNANLKPYADILVTSLTKYFSGKGDVMAGSIILNPESSFSEPFQDLKEDLFENTLFKEDADILAKNMMGFENRMGKINETTPEIVEFLRNHNSVETVHYSDSAEYNHLANAQGGLFSVDFKNPKNAPAFYDALNICKGPSLGTEFSIACPYTLLAHWDERKKLGVYGIGENLIRISIGIEEIKDLQKRFEGALQGL